MTRSPANGRSDRRRRDWSALRKQVRVVGQVRPNPKLARALLALLEERKEWKRTEGL